MGGTALSVAGARAAAAPACASRPWLFMGPAILVGVGYTDPGNWATDLEGGSRFGYELLWVLVLSNVLAIFLQRLCAKLGIASGLDLAQACRACYPLAVTFCLWILCELAIVACDLAEVVGSAVALNLLFGIPLAWGAVITAADVFLILFLQRSGMRTLEAFVAVLVGTVAVCLLIDLTLVQPVWGDVARGLRPHVGEASLYVAIGILGATVMPHNLYLHSALVRTRDIGETASQKRRALRTSFWNTLVALNLAFVVNAAILIVAASAFHSRGLRVAELQEAHALLAPLLGTTVASALFALGLLCAGQSASVTATMAGQFVMEGFVKLRMTAFTRRLLTRALAIVPAVTLLVMFGDASVLALLIATQVVLSLQLPFAIIPLLRFTASAQLMGPLVNKRVTTAAGWLVAALVVSANVWLLTRTFARVEGPLLMAMSAPGAFCLALLGYCALSPLRTPARDIRRVGAPRLRAASVARLSNRAVRPTLTRP